MRHLGDALAGAAPAIKEIGLRGSTSTATREPKKAVEDALKKRGGQ